MQSVACEKFRHAEGRRGRPANDAPCHCGRTYAEHGAERPKPQVAAPAAPATKAPPVTPIKTRRNPTPFSPHLLALYDGLIQQNGDCNDMLIRRPLY